MNKYGQHIKLRNGGMTVSNCDSAQDAIETIVSWARKSGERPPKWWQFWIPRWPELCVKEYILKESNQ